MQHSLAQLELDRRLAEDRVHIWGRGSLMHARRRRGPSHAREWAAAALAKLAWRLDPKSALRAWP
jgi:hypothetical protein